MKFRLRIAKNVLYMWMTWSNHTHPALASNNGLHNKQVACEQLGRMITLHH